MLTLHQRERHHSAEWVDTIASDVVREEAQRVLAARKPTTFTNCAGPCDGGRKLCPCPQACQRIANEADDSGGDNLRTSKGVLFGLALVLVGGAALAAILL